jgi:acylphosphatase
MERVHIKVHGRVQGVFFRAYTQEEATRLGLKGWVRNTHDGCVEAVAEGDRKALESFVSWCHHGPSAAKVSSVDVEWATGTGEFATFRVTF